MSKYGYAREKLLNAINVLATGRGDVRARLHGAYLHAHTLRPENFPEELWPDWKHVCDNLAKCGPIYNHKGEVEVGAIEHTLRRIKNKTGARLADKIFHLFCEMHFNEKYR